MAMRKIHIVNAIHNFWSMRRRWNVSEYKSGTSTSSGVIGWVFNFQMCAKKLVGKKLTADSNLMTCIMLALRWL